MFKKDEDLLEKVQQRATRQLPHLRHLEYPERLKKVKALGLETLAYRRQRAEVLQIHKIMKGIEHLDVNTFFQLVSNSRTRGHSMKVKKPRFKYMLRQNSSLFEVVITGTPYQTQQLLLQVWTSLNLFLRSTGEATPKNSVHIKGIAIPGGANKHCFTSLHPSKSK